jgi:CubicO group peptidase (beta-lactamase class C family)
VVRRGERTAVHNHRRTVARTLFRPEHPSRVGAVGGWRWDRPQSIEAAVREIDEADLTTAPGSRFEYSNSNYEVLAAMAEAVTATPHAVALRDRVLRPLGMSATTADTSTPPEGLVAGYYPWLGRFVARTPAPVPPGAAGSAMIVSTPRDLAKVVTAHVNDGPELRTALIAARTPLREVTPEASYASGFWCDPYGNCTPATRPPPIPRCRPVSSTTAAPTVQSAICSRAPLSALAWCS